MGKLAKPGKSDHNANSAARHLCASKSLFSLCALAARPPNRRASGNTNSPKKDILAPVRDRRNNGTSHSREPSDSSSMSISSSSWTSSSSPLRSKDLSMDSSNRNGSCSSNASAPIYSAAVEMHVSI